MSGLASKVEFVRQLVRFGESALGLYFGGAFQNLAPGHALPHWLYVSHRFLIKSAINTYGQPYINGAGFEEEFAALQKNFEALYFDTYLYTAEAWGSIQNPCPILHILIEQPRIRQSYVVLHEGVHSTLRAENATPPYEIEEPAAIAVADIGTLAFAETMNYRELKRQLFVLKAVRKKYERAVKTASVMLEETYAASAGKSWEEQNAQRKKAPFSAISADPIWQEAEDAGVTAKGLNQGQKINNAFFLRYGDYYKRLSLIESALKRFEKPKEAVAFIKKLPGELDAALRELESAANQK